MAITKEKIGLWWLVICCMCTELHTNTSYDIDTKALDAYEQTTRTPDDLSPEDKAIYEMFAALTLVVKEPIWHNTKAPSGRDVLYLLPYKISAIEHGGVAFNLFANVTNNMNVGASNLLNTGALNQELLPDIFQILTHSDKTLSDAEMSSLLVLIKKITLQEIKAGGVIQAGFVQGPFRVELNTSLHCAERNFWLSRAERQAIATTIGLSSGAGLDEREFVKYRFGLGDTRLKVGLNTLNKTKFQIDVGFETILPTSKFSYTPHYKTTNSDEIDSPESLEDNFYSTLKGVRDYLIDPCLGIGHFGFGCYVEAKANVFHNLANIWTRFSYDKLLPGKEQRLMLFKDTGSRQAVEADVTVIENGGPEETAAAMKKLRVDGTMFTEQYLFPSVFQTSVSPGGVFNVIFALSSDIKKMRFSAGYDFYMQQAEKIKAIYNTDVTMNQLLVSGAQASFAYQHKIFAEALYLNNKFKRCDLAYGLGGDVTVASKGIGRDWTLYAKLTVAF